MMVCKIFLWVFIVDELLENHWCTHYIFWELNIQSEYSKATRFFTLIQTLMDSRNFAQFLPSYPSYKCSEYSEGLQVWSKRSIMKKLRMINKGAFWRKEKVALWGWRHYINDNLGTLGFQFWFLPHLRVLGFNHDFSCYIPWLLAALSLWII